jgi:hypothetical protein
VRRYFKKLGRTIESGLTLEEQAQEHCSHPETSSATCKTARAKAITRRNGGDPWFDSHVKE